MTNPSSLSSKLVKRQKRSLNRTYFGRPVRKCRRQRLPLSGACSYTSGVTDVDKRIRFEKEALVHRQALDCFARQLTKGSQESEDLVQECLEKAWIHFHQFRQGTRCKSWLFTILANSYRMRLRSAPRRREVCVGLNRKSGWLDYLQPPVPSAEDCFGSTRVSSSLGDLVRELATPQRRVLLLSDLLGLSYQETSKILDIPVGTVRSRLSRARLSLRSGLVGERPQ